MSAFPDWQKHIVKQKRWATGCIPTGYEMILRAAGMKGIDFTAFQDNFDLDKDLIPGQAPQNNFVSVAVAIRERYPEINFTRKVFPRGSGKQKLLEVEAFITNQRPVLISLALQPFGQKGWHIMPVVDFSADELKLLWGVDPAGRPITKTITKHDFVTVHDSFQGGDDIAFLQAHKPSSTC